MKDIPFKHAFGDMMIMQQCPTKRSIISSVSHADIKDLEKYENKLWTIRWLSGLHYEVIDKKSGALYLVKGYAGHYRDDPISWSVYQNKKKRK